MSRFPSLTKKEQQEQAKTRVEDREKPFDVKECRHSNVDLDTIRNLFLTYFGIIRDRGRWYSFSKVEHLQPIWSYYAKGEYPPLEQMIPFANLQLEKLKKEHRQRIQATAEYEARISQRDKENAAAEAKAAAEKKKRKEAKAAAEVKAANSDLIQIAEDLLRQTEDLLRQIREENKK